MRDLIQALEEKKEEVARLRKYVLQLAKAEEELNVLIKAYQLLGGKVNEEPEESLALGLNSHHNDITITEAAQQVLKGQGKPMHIKDIYNQIRHKFGIRASKATVMAGIYRDVKRNQTFIKTAPGTFGLKE